MQEALLSIKEKYGKNAILKGMNLEEGATDRDRNAQIGGQCGHNASPSEGAADAGDDAGAWTF